MRDPNVIVYATQDMIDKYGPNCLVRLATQGFADNATKEEVSEMVEKMDNLMLDDGRTIDDLISEVMAASKSEDKEILILKIIDLVKTVEREVNGLNDELISYKYTHGHCITLTTLISRLRRELQGIGTNCKCFGDGGYAHVVTSIKHPEGFDNHLYYDINGPKQDYEVEDFVIESLMTPEERQSHEGQMLSREPYNTENDNIVTALITSKLHRILERQNFYSVK